MEDPRGPSEEVMQATAARRLTLDSLWNLAGMVLPLTVGLIAIPLLVRGLGIERFGVLSLAWTVIGYFSLLDLGIGRALTQVVARKMGAGEQSQVVRTAHTALVLMAGVGLVSGAVALPITRWLVDSVLRIPPELVEETRSAFWVLAFSVPVVIVTAGLRGVLEGLHRFRLVNAIRIPLGLFNFLGPLAVLPLDPSLSLVVAVLLAGRAVGLIVFAAACGHALPGIARASGFERGELLGLMRLAGWMTVSNVVGPIMVYMDRFFIGARLGLSDVTFYTTPYDVVTRLSVIPMGIVGVLFPAFSALVTEDPARAGRLYGRSWGAILGLMGPLLLAIFAFAPEGLELWLDAEFAARSAGVLRWLALGVLLNSLARVPFVLIQGAGKPMMTAIVHLVELPLYLALLVRLLSSHGIEGVAMAWTARVALDLVVFALLGRRLLPAVARSDRGTLIPLIPMGAAFAAALFLEGLLPRAALVLLTSAACALWLARSVVGTDLLRSLLERPAKSDG